jgi:hypothetical protein
LLCGDGRVVEIAVPAELVDRGVVAWRVAEPEAVLSELTDEIVGTFRTHPASRPNKPHRGLARSHPLVPPVPGRGGKVDVLRGVDSPEEFDVDVVRCTEAVTCSAERIGNQIGALGPFSGECHLGVAELEAVMSAVIPEATVHN